MELFNSFTHREILFLGLALLALLMFVVFLVRYLKDKRTSNKNRMQNAIVLLAFALGLFFFQRYLPQREYVFAYSDIPEYRDSGSYTLNDGYPFFHDEIKSWQEGELVFSDLDKLGRCDAAYAKLTAANLPEEERGEIDSIKPSGYQNAKYDDLIEDGFLYNRCHLIAFELCGENANEKNLITGTRYMNLNMTMVENMVSSYIHRTDNDVYYRVTPIFLENELVARGVLIEAESEDGVIQYCEYFYNVQPGIEINYATGESERGK